MKYINYQLYIVIQLLICFIGKIYSSEIIIKNKDKIMQNINIIINNQQQGNELNLIFDEDYYKIGANATNSFHVEKGLIFYSENGTTFDFSHSHLTSLAFYIDNSYSKVKFYNITFDDYYSEPFGYLITFFISNKNNNFEIEFNNCKFTNILGMIGNFRYESIKATQSTPQVIFNNCSF